MFKKFLKKAAEAPAKGLEKSVETLEEAGKTIITKKPLQAAERYWETLGPGLTTGAADDDPSGIATYSQVGAKYGFKLLWLAPFTFPLMAIVQEMCARIGLATGRGLANNIKNRFPRWVLYFCTTLLFAANTFNLGADLSIMAGATRLLIPAANFIILVFLFAVASLLLQIFSAYARYARYLKYLTLVLFAYFFSALSLNLDWPLIIREAFSPSLVFSKEQVILICAILGTTISPYLFFWQSSQEVEEEILQGRTTVRMRRRETYPEEIKKMRIDVWSGMFFSNLVMFFIIVACAGALFSNGLTDIKTAQEAALALRPFAGGFAFFLFTIGIIGVGLLSVPVLAGSASYAVSETFGWRAGLYRRLKESYAFYGIIIISMCLGLAMNFFNFNPIKALIAAAVINGLVAPIILFFIIKISSDKTMMGKWASGLLSKFFGWFVFGLMAIVGIATIVSLFAF
jgi:NRAMP (natural resistance-associated macrophage protein)-like metal ion transporter